MVLVTLLSRCQRDLLALFARVAHLYVTAFCTQFERYTNRRQWKPETVFVLESL